MFISFEIRRGMCSVYSGLRLPNICGSCSFTIKIQFTFEYLANIMDSYHTKAFKGNIGRKSLKLQNQFGRERYFQEIIIEFPKLQTS